MDVSVTSYEKRPQFYSVSPKVKLNKFDFTKKSKLLEWMGGKRIILSEICLQHGGEHLKVHLIFAGHSY